MPHTLTDVSVKPAFEAGAMAFNHRILVVDDNLAIHEDFRKILAGDPDLADFNAEEEEIFNTPGATVPLPGFILDFASQGNHALAKVTRAIHDGTPYSLVFMDVRMPPGWDGIETTARLWEVDPDLQVVICTAYSDYSWEKMIACLGSSDRLLILKKPFDTIEVFQIAHALTAKWTLLQASRRNAESMARAVMERTTDLELEMAVRKRSEETLKITLTELAKARDAALESSRQKSQFLANMSHEIRTPMNGVIGMGELLLLTNLDREQREYVDAIRSSADHLLDIINDILDSSKIDSGQMKFENVRFELREIVESTLDVVSPAARGKGLELAGCAPPDGCNALCGDPGRLKQVLTNLLGNAVKFTEHGEVSLTVSAVEESPDAVLLKFAIRDTGIGIDAAAHQRIFEPFHQADGSNTRKHGGTGLGLTICRQIIKAIGGQIGVTSEPGVGSEFWFTLGFKKSETSSEPVINALGNLQILVVDDNATNRDILQRQLTNLQMRPVAVASGPEALGFLRTAAAAGAPVPLAIVDMQMPGMDGITLAKLIKADPLISSIRLIMLSSLGDHLTDHELREAGVEQYIVKPVKQSRLHASLVTMLAGRAVGTGKSNAAPDDMPRHSVRILLAEDNRVNQQVALLQLKRLGYSADLAGNGHEALAALARVPYEIILMDCQMPGMDGYEATRRIRELYQRPIHIIAMTANAMAEDREKCLEAGMDLHLGKPVHMEDLKRVLSEWKPPSAAALDPPPVNLARLTEITGTDSGMFRRITNDYLVQAGEILALLDLAIERRDGREIHHLAHKLGGSSVSCGMTALVEPLSRLENMGKSFQRQIARDLYQQAGSGLLRVRQFLTDLLQTLNSIH